MSTDAIVTALNEANKGEIAAALAGLSLAAATFMATLRTECYQGLALLEIELRRLAGEHQLRKTQQTLDDLNASQANYDKQKLLIPTATTATRLLLWAFILFSFDLVDHLWLDPLSKEFIASELGSTLSVIASDLMLPIDILLLVGAPTLGIIFLISGANRIFALLRIDETQDKNKGTLTSLSVWVNKFKKHANQERAN